MENAEQIAERHRGAAVKIVRLLQDSGHVAYFAGGCVRDQLMGRHPSDFDVATDAPPERVQELFCSAKRVGEAFGVMLVRMGDVAVEVATFRMEWGYADGRHPDHVRFTDAQHDAQRRDFTINGLFFDPVADQVIDYVDGGRDIEQRVVRAIGRAQDRFAEDYLRMLRAVRFAARFEFDVDPATAEAIKLNAPKLKAISRERIGIEIEEMLEDRHRARAARLLQELHLDEAVLQEPRSEREPIALAGLPADAASVTGLAAWAIDRHMQPHQPQGGRVGLIDALDRIKVSAVVRTWRKALMLSNEHRDAAESLLRAMPRAVMWPELDVAGRKHLLARIDWLRVRQLLGALENLTGGDAVDLAALDADAAQLFAEGVAPSPLVTGDDLVAEGFQPGPAFKQILDQVYDAQLRGQIVTKDEAMAMARTLAESE